MHQTHKEKLSDCAVVNEAKQGYSVMEYHWDGYSLCSWRILYVLLLNENIYCEELLKYQYILRSTQEDHL